MKCFLDACVLFPDVMRNMLIGAARADLFVPTWSERVLEEWVRAVGRVQDGSEALVRLEISRLQEDFPHASVIPRKADIARLYLPDPDDVHVLAAAIAASADLLITLNAKDFPRHTLNSEGLSRSDPDAFLVSLWKEAPEVLSKIAKDAQSQVERVNGQSQTARTFFKKARLPKLAKALDTPT